MDWIIRVCGLNKVFQLHTQGNVCITALRDFSMVVHPGESLVLVGPSGAGKSTVLKLLYGNYTISSGSIRIRHRGKAVDLNQASPHDIHDIRKWTIGYVSQFLRVIPRVSSLDVVADPLKQRGVADDLAFERAAEMLTRLNIPKRLWQLSPTTFSGGEQQRINIARGFISDYPLMILDEPTASLDAENKTIVKDLILQAREKGTALVGIFHDPQDQKDIASTLMELEPNLAS